MTTREEFLEAMARYTLAIATPPYNGVETGNALISAYDAQAARVTELEAALKLLEWNGHSDAGLDWCSQCGAPRILGHDEDCCIGMLLEHKEAGR